MAETHLLMHVAAFLAATWWTKSWLMDAITQRWRYIIATLAGVPMWVVVAYSSTRVIEPSSGVGHVFGSMALAYFAAMMAFVSAIGLIAGLYLWAEDEAQDAASEVPGMVQPGRGD